MKSLFSQSGQVFLQFWVFEVILDAWGKFFESFKTPFLPFIVLKTTFWISRLQCKNRFEKQTTLGRDICKIILSVARQTKRQPHFVFSQINQPRVVCFLNRFLHWNRGIETVILSKIKGTNGIFKNPTKFPRASKPQNCGKTWPDWEKRLYLL